jgi:hypothetical protein
MMNRKNRLKVLSQAKINTEPTLMYNAEKVVDYTNCKMILDLQSIHKHPRPQFDFESYISEEISRKGQGGEADLQPSERLKSMELLGQSNSKHRPTKSETKLQAEVLSNQRIVEKCRSLKP